MQVCVDYWLLDVKQTFFTIQSKSVVKLLTSPHLVFTNFLILYKKDKLSEWGPIKPSRFLANSVLTKNSEPTAFYWFPIRQFVIFIFDICEIKLIGEFGHLL